ncbi:MAG: 50S ribosomal protein L18 [bacterium]|nr:50S ribosomal protein L18 [bacterium]
MKTKTQVKEAARQRRKKHIRKVVQGTSERPRMVIYRSLKQIYIQLVDDRDGKVLFGVSSLTPSVKKELSGGKGKLSMSQIVGKEFAVLAKSKGIDRVVFDRNGYVYHGRVKAVADGAREGGLNF